MKKILLFILCLPFTVIGQDNYRVTLLRAAPGELSNLIDYFSNSQDSKGSHLLRHSQGDQWDLMLIEPLGEGSSFSDPSRHFGQSYYNIISWHEEAIVEGPQFERFEEYFSNNNFFHIEMFVAIAGKQEELLMEREMENFYLEETDRKPNLIFIRKMGFRYGIFTIGAYESLIAYAEGGNQPEEVQERAAKKAGFSSASDIGFYLRSLISEHHDTLANKVK